MSAAGSVPGRDANLRRRLVCRLVRWHRQLLYVRAHRPGDPRGLAAVCIGIKVNISHFDVPNQAVQIQQYCQSAYSLPVVAVWTNIIGGTFPVNGSPAWNVCDPPADVNFTYREPMWIAVWVIYFGFYGFLALWILYKRLREKVSWKTRAIARFVRALPSLSSVFFFCAQNVPLVTLDDSSSGNLEKEKKEDSQPEQFEFKVEGFNDDIFGYFMLAYVWAISLGTEKKKKKKKREKKKENVVLNSRMLWI